MMHSIAAYVDCEFVLIVSNCAA